MKLNYFELFEIPVAFELDASLLTQKYYALSMQFHPDRFTLKSDEEQARALEKSTEINEAYRILKNKQKRVKYILQLHNVDFIEGQEKVPQEFLMEMMDINEELMEYKFDPTPEKLEALNKELRQLEDTLDMEVSAIFAKFNSKTPNQTNLQTVKSYYLKNQYLNNLKNNLNG